MSLGLIKQEVRRFLSTTEPEVVCIKGRWGVGKTFAWHRQVEECKNVIALPKYSYVSLFGVNSLDELKYAIFENAVASSDAGIEPSWETLQSDTTAVAKQVGKRSLSLLQQLPKIKGLVGSLGPVWFLMVRRMVICLDDIERRGKNLSVRDVLGLVSSLKERKGCKVSLILNDEALEEDKKDFDAYYEKVVDTSLSFAPTPIECAQIALSPGQKVQDLVRENCIKLGILNIRLIKKIERAALRLGEFVRGLDDQVLIQAIPSLAVLGWSLYDRNTAPPIEFLRQRGSLAALTRQKKGDAMPPQEVAWNALLDAYRWSGFDEFDEVLLDGIRDGYFDPTGVQKYATDIDAKAKAARSTSTFTEAWNRYTTRLKTIRMRCWMQSTKDSMRVFDTSHR
jgi:hypothetical protein